MFSSSDLVKSHEPGADYMHVERDSSTPVRRAVAFLEARQDSWNAYGYAARVDVLREEQADLLPAVQAADEFGDPMGTPGVSYASLPTPGSHACGRTRTSPGCCTG